MRRVLACGPCCGAACAVAVVLTPNSFLSHAPLLSERLLTLLVALLAIARAASSSPRASNRHADQLLAPSTACAIGRKVNGPPLPACAICRNKWPTCSPQATRAALGPRATCPSSRASLEASSSSTRARRARWSPPLLSRRYGPHACTRCSYPPPTRSPHPQHPLDLPWTLNTSRKHCKHYKLASRERGIVPLIPKRSTGRAGRMCRARRNPTRPD